MTKSDKIIISITVTCLIAGVIHTSLTKRNPRTQQSSKPTRKENIQLTQSTPTTSGQSEDIACSSPLVLRHNVQIEMVGDFSKSRSLQRKLAVQADKNKNTSSFDPQSIDYFAAREAMKDILFDKSYEGPLTEEEKWELIQSRNLPW